MSHVGDSESPGVRPLSPTVITPPTLQQIPLATSYRGFFFFSYSYQVTQIPMTTLSRTGGAPLKGLRVFSRYLTNAATGNVQGQGPENLKDMIFEENLQNLNRLQNSGIRNDWTRSEVRKLYNTPLMELIHSAAVQHRRFHNPSEVQLCTLMNIKTGGCSEDCKYCAQSSRYSTGVEAEKAVKLDQVLEAAREAKANGSTRFCMGAAWRDMKGRKRGLKNIAEMVKAVNDMGMESCVTLGMVDSEQMKELADAGLTAYNHNIDTSREHYPKVITTRSFDERLQTIDNVQKSGVGVCTGGILGLGETPEDHVGFLHTLATLPQHPESLPINRLVPIKGTPLGDELKGEIQLSFDAIVRTIATARLLMPQSIIRLAAGRYTMKESEQMMCFMAGVNAIFTGKKMLTTMCNGWDEDKAMLERWGMKPMKSFTKNTVRVFNGANKQTATSSEGFVHATSAVEL